MTAVFKITKWRANDLIKKAQAEQFARLQRAAIHLQNEIKKQISTKGVKCGSNESAGRSAPGQPPNIECGELRRSISREVDKTTMTARVGSNKPYAKYLELGTRKMAARPFLRNTLAEQRNTIKRILLN